jgi:hypothetical protein
VFGLCALPAQFAMFTIAQGSNSMVSRVLQCFLAAMAAQASRLMDFRWVAEKEDDMEVRIMYRWVGVKDLCPKNSECSKSFQQNGWIGNSPDEVLDKLNHHLCTSQNHMMDHSMLQDFLGDWMDSYPKCVKE